MTIERENDLPEGVIDAVPPGGWESGQAADAETAARDDAASRSSRLSESGLPPDGPVEGTQATQGADPDLVSDEEAGR